MEIIIVIKKANNLWSLVKIKKKKKTYTHKHLLTKKKKN